MMGPTIGLIPPEIERPGLVWDEELESYEGWAKYNRHYWLHDWRDFLEFFVGEIFSEPHSTKQIEDSVAYGLDTTPEVIVVAQESSHNLVDRENAERMLRDLRCPVVVAHGTDDHIIPFERGVNVAALAGGDFVELRGSGHALQARQPVQIDLLLRELAERVGGRPPRRRTWARSLARTKRALLVSSPIGLGHAWRDVAIADELRRRVPGLEIHWLAQHPVTTVLERRGETIHPASWELAPESEHIDREAGEHDLHAFQAIRRMDEILCANFMLFHDVVRDEQYDVWIGDEAWELDHFLHENPELKTAPYVWLSDFVGFLPMPSGGEHEAFLTADYNAEMIEHIARYPRVRDLALFVGDPEDIVPETFGPDLPPIRDWTEQHFRFAGYIPGFDPATVADRAALRAELGYDDEPFCVVSVGGSGVGAPLLHRVVECLPPDLRTLVVTGPRIDPDTVPRRDNVEVRGYVHELYLRRPRGGTRPRRRRPRRTGTCARPRSRPSGTRARTALRDRARLLLPPAWRRRHARRSRRVRDEAMRGRRPSMGRRTSRALRAPLRESPPGRGQSRRRAAHRPAAATARRRGTAGRSRRGPRQLHRRARPLCRWGARRHARAAPRCLVARGSRRRNRPLRRCRYARRPARPPRAPGRRARRSRPSRRREAARCRAPARRAPEADPRRRRP